MDGFVSKSGKAFSASLVVQDDGKVSFEFPERESNETGQKCPHCGKPIARYDWGFGCTGYKDGCKFSLRGTLAKRQMTEEEFSQLVENGTVGPLDGFQGKKGGFSAILQVDGSTGEVKFVFPDNGGGASGEETGLDCPHCGKKIQEYKWGWGCSGYKDGCKFSVRHKMFGRDMAWDEVQALISEGALYGVDGFVSKNGKEFSADLVISEEDGNVRLDFGDD